MSFSFLSTYIATEVKRIISWAAPVENGKICLIIDPCFTSSINRIVDMNTLQTMHVKEVHELSGVTPLETSCEHVLYIIRPNEEMIGRLAFQSLKLESVKSNSASDTRAPVFVAFVPRPTAMCARSLETLGLYGRLQITSLPPLAITYLDDDLISFEDSTAFKRGFLDNDPSVIDNVVRNLLEIQNVYGKFDEISGKGKLSSAVCESLCRLQGQGNVTDKARVFSEADKITRVICIDRTVDLITPMMLGFTYEGIIDECIGIDNGYCNLKRNIFTGTKQKDADERISGNVPEANTDKNEMVKYPLFSSDPHYAQIRDKSFPYVLSTMPKLVGEVSKKLGQRNQAKTVCELKGFVKCLPGYLNELDSVTAHTNLLVHLTSVTNSPSFLRILRSEDSLINMTKISDVLDTIEYSIAQGEPWQQVTRLVCLWSQISGGLKTEDYDTCCNQLINGYGAALMLPVLTRLAKCGFLCHSISSSQRASWKSLRRDLNLISDKGNGFDNPSDYHFVHGYSGYAPISVRFIEKRITENSWNSVNTLFSPDQVSFNKKLKLDSSPGATLVVFIGGITRSEVAALRFLNQNRPESQIVISGCLTTGSTLLESMRMLSPV